MESFNGFLPVAGFVVGLLVGLTGMGGGAVMTPVLMLGLGLPPTVAVGTDLAYATLTKLAGAWQHGRQGTVDKRLVWQLALGSVPATLAAVALLGWLHRHAGTATVDAWLKRLIAAALLLATAVMLHRLLNRQHPARRRVTSGGRIVAIGALGGLLVGLTSVGSGSLILALLVMATPLPAERLVGTDIAHATLLVGTAALAHLSLGYVDVAMAGALLIGSIPGVLLGSHLTLRVPRRALQFGLVGLLMTSAVQLLR